MAMRTFIGSCTTLILAGANLGALAGLEGEKSWICLMLCNLDILVAVSVLHWATSLDKRIPNASAAVTEGGSVATEDQKTAGQSSCASNSGLRILAGMQRKNGVALTGEDVVLNIYGNEEGRLGVIGEEASDVTPKDVTPKDVTPKDVTPKDVTPKDVAPKDVTPKDVRDVV